MKRIWTATDVANEVRRILMVTTNYIVQLRLTREGVHVKVGNTANKLAGIVNVSNHFKGGGTIRNELLAARLAYRLHKYLKVKK